MITGDKMETAEAIGRKARLITSDMQMLYGVGADLTEVKKSFHRLDEVLKQTDV